MTQVHITCLHGMPPALELSLVPAMTSFFRRKPRDSHSGNYRSLPTGKHVASPGNEKAAAQETRTQPMPLA